MSSKYGAPAPKASKQPARDYSLLSKLGLSKTAVSCYQSLANDGPATVNELSKRLKLTRNGLYRVLAGLHGQGLVTHSKLDGQSALYAARPLYQAVEQYFKYQRRLIRPLLSGWDESAKHQRS
jgi:sugar-specific transcriptional regulator TrmB